MSARIMAIAVALATASVPSIAHAEADAGTGEALGAAECLQFNGDGMQVWIGGSGSGDLEALATELSALVDSSPDLATGVAYCSHYEAVMLFLPPPVDGERQAAFDDALSRVRAAHPAQTAYTTEVAAPESVLRPLSSAIITELGDEGVIETGADIHTGGLRIGVDIHVTDDPEHLRPLIDAIVEREHGTLLPVRLESSSPDESLPGPPPRQGDQDPPAEHRFAPGFFAVLHRLLAAAAARAGRTG